MKVTLTYSQWKIAFGQVDFCETSLEIAARATRMAVCICKRMVPVGYLKKSMLATARFMSSSCTGVYTAEVAMAIVQKQLGCQKSKQVYMIRI